VSRIVRGALPQDNYTIVANTAVRDPRLPLASIGLLVQILSHRAGWRTSERGLAKINNCGRGRIRSALAPLIEHGYITVEQTRRDGRFDENDWVVTDTPTVVGFPDHGFSYQ